MLQCNIKIVKKTELHTGGITFIIYDKMFFFFFCKLHHLEIVGIILKQ